MPIGTFRINPSLARAMQARSDAMERVMREQYIRLAGKHGGWRVCLTPEAKARYDALDQRLDALYEAIGALDEAEDADVVAVLEARRDAVKAELAGITVEWADAHGPQVPFASLTALQRGDTSDD